MSNQTNPTTDVPTLLNQLKKTFEETFQDASSAKDAKDVKQKIDHLINPFRSVSYELPQINEFLRQDAAKADQYDFQALSGEERIIIDKADEDPLVKSLQVSYEIFLRLDELKRDPRICLFLAIFPENAVLRKRFLIYWWIGEGLVQNEEEGERIFEELLDLELLIPYPTDSKCPRVSKCQIFPWIRYMLISVAMKEKLLNLGDDIPPRFDPTGSWRACLVDDHTNFASDLGESEPETLSTLFNVNARYLDFQDQWLAKLKRLVVLQLGRWQVSPTYHIEVRDDSFLTVLKTQKVLKYLNLRGISRITTLPDSIRELVSLEILDLKACHNLETLPAALTSLKKLTHFNVSECYLLESLPKGLDKLTSLQVLKGFIVGHSQTTPIRIEHLPSLRNLKRLSIHIGSEAIIQKEKFHKLKDLEKLKCLKISWGQPVLGEFLSFPPGLQRLDLEGIPHETVPEWLNPSKLRNLETLYIKGGKLRNLLDEGEKWDVKYLVLKYTNLPPITEETLKPVFPSLQYVKKVEWIHKDEQEFLEYEWNKDGQ